MKFGKFFLITSLLTFSTLSQSIAIKVADLDIDVASPAPHLLPKLGEGAADLPFNPVGMQINKQFGEEIDFSKVYNTGAFKLPNVPFLRSYDMIALPLTVAFGRIPMGFEIPHSLKTILKTFDCETEIDFMVSIQQNPFFLDGGPLLLKPHTYFAPEAPTCSKFYNMDIPVSWGAFDWSPRLHADPDHLWPTERGPVLHSDRISDQSMVVMSPPGCMALSSITDLPSVSFISCVVNSGPKREGYEESTAEHTVDLKQRIGVTFHWLLGEQERDHFKYLNFTGAYNFKDLMDVFKTDGVLQNSEGFKHLLRVMNIH